jgi:hypothetical protein
VLRSLLRFDPDLPAGRLRIAPVVPDDWLPLRLQNLRLGDLTLTVEVDVDGGVHVDGLPDSVTLVGA